MGLSGSYGTFDVHCGLRHDYAEYKGKRGDHPTINEVSDCLRGKNSRWREVKRLSGMSPIFNSSVLSSLLQLENNQHLSPLELANLINNSFLEAINVYTPLDDQDAANQCNTVFPPNVTTPLSVFYKLKSLNPRPR